MADIDLHTHSRFFHAFPGRPTWYDKFGAQLLVATARARGLDGIAITNHDYYTDFDLPTGDLTVLPGIEISTTAGHLLLVGPDPPTSTKPNGISPEEAVALARERGCAVVMAHPYRNSHIKDLDVPVDAVEVNGKRSGPTTVLEELAAQRDLPLVGGSDAHFPNEVGRAFATVDVESVTPENVAQAIRDGRTEFRVMDRFPDQYIRRLYGIVHRLKGHTEPDTTAGEGGPASVTRTTLDGKGGEPSELRPEKQLTKGDERTETEQDSPTD